MTVQSAVRGVVEEGTALADQIRENLGSLDLSTTAILALRDKYDTITRKVLGVGYDQLVSQRALPPISPTVLYDQVRLSYTEVTALGAVFVPSAPTQSNLKDLREFYLSADKNLTLVSERIDAHPPGIPETNTFDVTINKFEVVSTNARNPDGTAKTRDQIAAELGIDTFEFFQFPELPELVYVVFPVFLAINKQLDALSKSSDVPKDQMSTRVVWYGTVNPTSENFSKMKVTLGLNNLQIRSASFGDDLARSSSSVFLGLLDAMLARFQFATSSLPSQPELLRILDAVQQDAFRFLAQMTFGTTVLSDTEVVSGAFEAGVTETELEHSLVNRDDQNYTGANLNANELRVTVFPQTSNEVERRALGFLLQQEPDTLRFTSSALNLSPTFRQDVVTASKRVVASLDAHRVIVGRENSSQRDITEALLAVLADIVSLQTAYSTFLTPPDPAPRIAGARTVESTNNTLTRACNLVKSLRIQDQITGFPEDFDFQIDPDLQEVLDGLSALRLLIDEYLGSYRHGNIRDFLASCVSVGSMTNVVLADGEPATSNLVTELPAGIEELRSQIQTVLLSTPEAKVLFNSVSLQVGTFASALRGDSEEDPVGRLLSLPVTVIDALLPSAEFPEAFSIPLENGQEEALRQIRDSFDVLRRTAISTIRDLGVYGSNYGCAINDARFFVARLSGDSIRNLVTELRKS
ncbi:hypothetical protein LCGC14_0407390 [marine sediment metagenome]|uniref:Uncharacterized protein n=1 Tax=marine sediment metagenome TaxID=412755 RepID=A0A0F9TD39_9ZZZZ